jgi:hypothetical protein
MSTSNDRRVSLIERARNSPAHCSGPLYHVFSPLGVLCGLRPLVKRGGLMIVSTNVVVEDGYTMEFNNAGRTQAEQDTFWYPAVRLLDYTLRHLRLRPIVGDQD